MSLQTSTKPNGIIGRQAECPCSLSWKIRVINSIVITNAITAMAISDEVPGEQIEPCDHSHLLEKCTMAYPYEHQRLVELRTDTKSSVTLHIEKWPLIIPCGLPDTHSKAE